LNNLYVSILGLIVLFSFIGYGSIIRRVFFKSEIFHWANEAAWGMSFVVVLGGWLIFFEMVSKSVLNTIIFVGLVLSIFFKLQDIKSRVEKFRFSASALKKNSLIVYIFYILIAVIFISIAITYWSYTNHISSALPDDLKYLFPHSKQLLELGTFNSDPFDLFRVTNGLGGQQLLNAIILANTSFNNVHILDGGVAFLICIGLLWSICEKRPYANLTRLIVIAFMMLLPFQRYSINTGSFMTGIALCLSLYSFIDSRDFISEKFLANSILIALIIASAISLKYTFFPFLILTITLCSASYIYKSKFKKAPILEFFLILIFILIFLTPYMLCLKQTSATMFWPLLGEGYSETAYGNYINGSYNSVNLSNIFSVKIPIILSEVLSKKYFPLLILMFIYFFLGLKTKIRGGEHAFLISALLSSSIMMLLNIPDNAYQPIAFGAFHRYFFPLVIVSLLIALSCLSDRFVLIQQRFNTFLALIFSAMILFTIIKMFQNNDLTTSHYQVILNKIIGNQQSGSVISEIEVSRRIKAQDMVPPNEAIFSVDLYTLAYNFKRNKIYYHSQPGGASLPPGIPISMGAEAVSKYLLNNNIRYLAYNYSDQAGYPIEKNFSRLNTDKPFLRRTLFIQKIAMDKVCYDLGFIKERIYDDGNLYIVDLQRSTGRHASTYPNYFQIGKTILLPWVNSNGFDSRKIWTKHFAEVTELNYILDKEDQFLIINFLGFHPNVYDIKKLNFHLFVNEKELNFVKKTGNSFIFSLQGSEKLINKISIKTNTFKPSEEKDFIFSQFFGSDINLGVDVETIKVVSVIE
jgi:hypothetical protein